MNHPLVVNVRSAEPGTFVYVGRSSPSFGFQRSAFANPFHITHDGDRDTVIRKFRRFMLDHPQLVEKAKRELRGKVLGCWCAPEPCHADILAKIANGEEW